MMLFCLHILRPCSSLSDLHRVNSRCISAFIGCTFDDVFPRQPSLCLRPAGGKGKYHRGRAQRDEDQVSNKMIKCGVYDCVAIKCKEGQRTEEKLSTLTVLPSRFWSLLQNWIS